jgi:4-aminobutyrate aminotransferase/(S)-3-amino-2-methylpropionate transaminase
MRSAFSLEPRQVPRVETPFRRISTPIPVPESIPILQELGNLEPVSMLGQPPVIWDHAEGFQVFDRWGNKWLDWSSGVLVANAGHGRREIRDALIAQIEHGLLHSYVFPSELRAKLVKRLVELAPPPLNKAYLLTTGSEAIECAIKLSRAWGQRTGGSKKLVIVSFEGAFHGRTLGAQQAGGIPSLKQWIGNLDPGFVQVPFPGDLRTTDRSFDVFERTLTSKGVAGSEVAGVIVETFQGGNASFMPPAYARALRAWCDSHGVVLTFDEIQAAFGRTGKLWGFEHYGIVPDLIAVGKGITSSLPLSAVIGRAEIMDQFPPGSMTSTHAGNPLSVVAALTNIDLIVGENLPQHAAEVGPVLRDELEKIRRHHHTVVAEVSGRGLVYGMHIVQPGSLAPNPDLAAAIVSRAVEKGLLLFAPVGLMGSLIKVNPPLIVTEDAIRDGATALLEAFEESVTSAMVPTNVSAHKR